MLQRSTCDVFKLVILILYSQVNYGASFIEFFAEEAKRVYGDIIPPTIPDRRLFVLKQAIYLSPALLYRVTCFFRYLLHLFCKFS